jgi:hypothetical protein
MQKLHFNDTETKFLRSFCFCFVFFKGMDVTLAYIHTCLIGFGVIKGFSPFCLGFSFLFLETSATAGHSDYAFILASFSEEK